MRHRPGTNQCNSVPDAGGADGGQWRSAKITLAICSLELHATGAKHHRPGHNLRTPSSTAHYVKVVRILRDLACELIWPSWL